MFSVLGASAWLPFLPMAPIQVLTNNLLYDLSQSAIPSDRVDTEELRQPRRWATEILAATTEQAAGANETLAAVSETVATVDEVSQTAAQAALFHTGWFVESLLSQTLVIHIIRTARVPFVQSRASVPLIATTLGVCAVGVSLPYSPLAGALGLVALPWSYWPILGGILLAYLGLAHLLMRRVWHPAHGVVQRVSLPPS